MDLKTTLIGFINDGILGGKSPITLNRYKYCISFFFDYLKKQFLSLDTSSLTSDNLQGFFIYGLKERGWNKVTYVTKYIKLHAYLNWLVKKGIITANPLDGLPKPKMPPRFPKSLNEQEVIELLRATTRLKTNYGFARIRNKAIIATLIFTGLRKSELLNLKCKDVDLVNNFIFVENGKGNKSREVPLEPEILKPILLEYAEYRNRLGRANNYFFNGQWAGVRENNQMGYTVLDRLFRELTRLMNKRIHAHQLRHTFATTLLEKTEGDIYTLQQLMGHSDISTTTIYLSSTRKRKVSAIASLSDILDLKSS